MRSGPANGRNADLLCACATVQRRNRTTAQPAAGARRPPPPNAPRRAIAEGGGRGARTLYRVRSTAACLQWSRAHSLPSFLAQEIGKGDGMSSEMFL